MALTRSRKWQLGCWQRLADGAVDLLFPANCLACNTELPETLGRGRDRIGYCPSCRELLAHNDWPTCLRCAARVPKLSGEVASCARCSGQKLWFDRTFALGPYKGVLRDQVLEMKTDSSERLANALGLLMASQLGHRLRDLRLDAIVPAPMHLWRRLSRGTNPPAAMASVIGRELGLPVYPKILQRRRYSRPQVGLSKPARFLNMRGQMRVRKSYQLDAPHLLLVDDILTTGATCSEATRMLKRAGAAQVTVLVAARTHRE